MSLPPVEIPLGAIRFNSDSQKLEYFNGDVWMQVHTFNPNLNGGTRGLIGGGSSIPGGSGATNIDFITIPTAGNATAFHTLSYGNAYRGGLASSTRGIFVNGQNDQTTDYVTISTTGESAVFGEITNDNMGGATLSNEIKGFRAGGADGGTHTNEIIGMTIASTSETFFDFGDLMDPGIYMRGCSSPTRGVIFGGATPGVPSAVERIQYINMGSNGDATHFGDLITNRKYATCLSNSTRALTATGSDASGSNLKSIEYVTISTTGNASDFGDAVLTSSTAMTGSCSSPTRGILAGAYPSSGHIEYVTIPTRGEGVDFGDLNYHGYYCGGCSNGHGGLG